MRPNPKHLAPRGVGVGADPHRRVERLDAGAVRRQPQLGGLVAAGTPRRECFSNHRTAQVAAVLGNSAAWCPRCVATVVYAPHFAPVPGPPEWDVRRLLDHRHPQGEGQRQPDGRAIGTLALALALCCLGLYTLLQLAIYEVYINQLYLVSTLC
jgi:hypothetical protein